MTKDHAILQRVRILMVVHGWKQNDVAARMNRKPAWVSKVLAGRIRLRTEIISEFARAFGIRDELLILGSSNTHDYNVNMEDEQEDSGHDKGPSTHE